MIPFIDVLLVLLIIFMVTAPQPTVDLNVEMPSGIPRYVPPPILPVIVEIRDVGGTPEIFVGSEQVSLASLGQRTLAQIQANNPDAPFEAIFAEAPIYVRADQSTAYQNVVNVLDALRDAKFAKVGIFAQTAEEG